MYRDRNNATDRHQWNGFGQRESEREVEREVEMREQFGTGVNVKGMNVQSKMRATISIVMMTNDGERQQINSYDR